MDDATGAGRDAGAGGKRGREEAHDGTTREEDPAEPLTAGGECSKVELSEAIRGFLLRKRQALLIELAAIEALLGLPRSVEPRHRK